MYTNFLVYHDLYDNLLNNNKCTHNKVNNIDNLLNYTTIKQYNNLTNINITQCPITLDYFDKNDEIIEINKCKHAFIKECFIIWYTQNNTCPVCRVEICV
jgi:hypothetical protein